MVPDESDRRYVRAGRFDAEFGHVTVSNTYALLYFKYGTRFKNHLTVFGVFLTNIDVFLPICIQIITIASLDFRVSAHHISLWFIFFVLYGRDDVCYKRVFPLPFAGGKFAAWSRCALTSGTTVPAPSSIPFGNAVSFL